MSRRIAKEIKEEINGKVQAGERVMELAEQYAVSTKTIYGWLRQNSGEAVVSTLHYNKLKRENEELKRLIGELVRHARIKSVCAEALTSRQIIAAKNGKRHDSQLVLATLHQAFATRQRTAIFHSDQDPEFMAQQCTDYLEAWGYRFRSAMWHPRGRIVSWSRSLDASSRS